MRRNKSMNIGAYFEKYPNKVYFFGSWGFQWYMEKNGYPMIDLNHSKVKRNFMIVQAYNNGVFRMMQEPFVDAVYKDSHRGPRWLGTMSEPVAAGFYSSVWGPLPYAFGDVPEDIYLLFSIDMEKKEKGYGPPTHKDFIP